MKRLLYSMVALSALASGMATATPTNPTFTAAIDYGNSSNETFVLDNPGATFITGITQDLPNTLPAGAAPFSTLIVGADWIINSAQYPLNSEIIYNAPNGDQFTIITTLDPRNPTEVDLVVGLNGNSNNGNPSEQLSSTNCTASDNFDLLCRDVADPHKAAPGAPDSPGNYTPDIEIQADT